MQRVFLIILACLALVAAGCGDDSDTSTTSGGETTAESSSPQNEDTTADEEAKEEEAEPELPEVGVPKGPPPKELVIEDLEKGSGPTAKAGDEVSVYYVGKVYKTKELFDTNWGGDEPFTFKLGGGEVIKGWDKGIQGMKVDGVRKLIIPPDLAYGPEAIWPSIPAYSTLVFQVKLIDVK